MKTLTNLRRQELVRLIDISPAIICRKAGVDYRIDYERRTVTVNNLNKLTAYLNIPPLFSEVVAVEAYGWVWREVPDNAYKQQQINFIYQRRLK